MADLPSGSFTAVNDVEVASEAPLSEAFFVKIGSNQNNLDARTTTNAGNISTNASNITTLQGQALAIETDSGTVPVGAATITTFSAAPQAVFITVTSVGNVSNSAVVIPGQTTVISVAGTGGDPLYNLSISGANLDKTDSFIPAGHNFRVVGVV